MTDGLEVRRTELMTKYGERVLVMKNSNRCSKCDSQDIIRIPGWEADTFGAGNYIPIGWWAGNAKVARYLCGQCGFSEEWVESPEDIAKVRHKYAKKESS
jgi:ribosomal protein S27AE